ncbi:tyrosine-protein phosphatase [Levilactobacillus cerevisiae]|uniref:tyrosine-protein phosphatase n=1 Tax=Levilactobacillus cerevisiae TaxID=1704076 RepID=UPI000F7BB168|nr:tyrosine-protein phosphatase [Levilactobacillus cerevisiae]
MPERVLNLTGGFNFRDLGGYQASDGRVTKWHTLLRTAHLANLTDEDYQQLEDLGVGLVVDLRSTAEVSQFPDRMGAMKVVHLPVFDYDETESAASNEELQRLFERNGRWGYHRMMRVYRRLVGNPHAQKAYHDFFQLLLAWHGKSGVIFHCSAGKDRTGMAAVYLLRALGVSPDTVLADYLMTNAASTEHVAERIAAIPPGTGRLNLQQSVHDLATVNEDYYQQAMCLINYEYGGMMAYLREVLGVTEDDQYRLQQLYLT